jgi:hypothetical protein
LTTLHVQNVSISYITHPYIGEERENIEQNNRGEIRRRGKERDSHNRYITMRGDINIVTVPVRANVTKLSMGLP